MEVKYELLNGFRLGRTNIMILKTKMEKARSHEKSTILNILIHASNKTHKERGEEFLKFCWRK
jgi:hypothetical protein